MPYHVVAGTPVGNCVDIAIVGVVVLLMLLWPLFVTELTVIAFAKKVVIFIIVVVNNGISINVVSAAVEYVAFVTFTVSDVFFC
jgi:hypothetical protein